MSNDLLSRRERDMRRQAEMLDKNLRELDRSIQKAHDKINRVQGAENGYPVGSSFPTGVSDGFVFFHTGTRRLHMYDGTTWFSIADVGAYINALISIPIVQLVLPFSAVDYLSNTYDVSGQGRHFTSSVVYSLLNNRVIIASSSASTFIGRANEVALQITTTISLGIWVKVTSTALSQIVFGKFGASGQYSYEIAYIAAGGFRFQITSTGSAPLTFVDTATVSANTWYHVVASYNPSTAMNIYLNGVKTTNTTSIPAAIFASTAPLRIGIRGDATFPATGSFAFAWLSKSLLTDAYINSLYEEGAPFFI